MTRPAPRHSTHIICAICTPLNDDQSLCVPGLAAHIEDQASAGFGGLLVGGTMGLMQLLSDSTYRDLIRNAIDLGKGRFEMLIGVGDTSFARTRDRIEFAHKLPIDGVVIVTPSFWKYSRADLLCYFRSLADFSRKPVYLYDLPTLTGVKLDADLVLELAAHPNIAGVKCSIPWEQTRPLIDAAPRGFRIIPAQPCILDQLVRLGIKDNLDGIYGLVPELTAAILIAAENGRWEQAAHLQADMAALSKVLGTYGVFPAATAILNARGIPGSVAPAPMQPLSAERRDQLLREPVLVRHIPSQPAEAR